MLLTSVGCHAGPVDGRQQRHEAARQHHVKGHHQQVAWVVGQRGRHAGQAGHGDGKDARHQQQVLVLSADLGHLQAGTCEQMHKSTGGVMPESHVADSGQTETRSQGHLCAAAARHLPS